MLPSARLLAETFGLALEKIPSTGPKGHLLKGDILSYIDTHSIARPTSKPLAPKAQNAVKRQPTSQVSKSSVAGKQTGKCFF